MLHDPGQTLDPLADVEDGGGQESRQGRLSSAVVVALHLRAGRDHGPARILGDARRPRRLGADLETARTRFRRSSSPGYSTSCACTSGHQVDALRPYPWQPKTSRSPQRAPTWASRPGYSRSGFAAPDVTTSARSRGSATPTPIPSVPTWRSSPTRAAPAVADNAQVDEAQT